MTTNSATEHTVPAALITLCTTIMPAPKRCPKALVDDLAGHDPITTENDLV